MIIPAIAEGLENEVFASSHIADRPCRLVFTVRKVAGCPRSDRFPDPQLRDIKTVNSENAKRLEDLNFARLQLTPLIVNNAKQMSLFGKSDYEKQLAEYQGQLSASKAQQEAYERQLAEQQRLLESSTKQQEIAQRQQQIAERQQQETAEIVERSRQHQERYAKLLDIWEEQARRFDAILAKWEQKG